MYQMGMYDVNIILMWLYNIIRKNRRDWNHWRCGVTEESLVIFGKYNEYTHVHVYFMYTHEAEI